MIRTCKKRSARAVPRPSRPTTSCGFLNRINPASGNGLIAMILQPLRFARWRAKSIRGWFVPGFCPRIRMTWARSKSSSVTVPLPMPMAGREGGAARFVAHVRTVGQVVRAELPHEQLIKKRRLVAGPARGIEDRLVRRRQGVEFGGDQVGRPRPRKSVDNACRRDEAPWDGSAGPAGPANSPTVAIVRPGYAGQRTRGPPDPSRLPRQGLWRRFRRTPRCPVLRPDRPRRNSCSRFRPADSGPAGRAGHG